MGHQVGLLRRGGSSQSRLQTPRRAVDHETLVGGQGQDSPCQASAVAKKAGTCQGYCVVDGVFDAIQLQRITFGAGLILTNVPALLDGCDGCDGYIAGRNQGSYGIEVGMHARASTIRALLSEAPISRKVSDEDTSAMHKENLLTDVEFHFPGTF